MIFARKDEYGRTPRQAAEDAALRQAAAGAAMNLRRWSLNQALAWISTRSPEALGLGEGPLWISIWCEVTPGNHPFPEVGEAWRALAEAMAEGEIFGLGTRAAMTREGGFVSQVQGVRFPPEDQLGAALTYRVFEEDDPAGVLAPDESPFAQAWREFRDVTFKREAVMALFPALTEPSSTAESAISSAAQEKKCQQWLQQLMADAPRIKPKAKNDLADDARAKFHVSKRGFDRVWANSILATGATWDAAGAPKKKGHQ